jgi:hypothetical protein
MLCRFFILIFFGVSHCFSQAFDDGAIVGSIGMGAPHLFKSSVKLVTSGQKFNDLFQGKLVVKDFGGINPVLYKAEFGFKNYFGLGISGGIWTMRFSVEDHYNVLKAAKITGTDSMDTYKFKITSKAIGIRPNFHIPLKNDNVDIFFGLGLGMNKNKINIDFSSTDINRVIPDLDYDLNLPGFIYISPTIGYRQYFNEYFALNFELGYDKGAIISGGFALRLNYSYKDPVVQPAK